MKRLFFFAFIPLLLVLGACAKDAPPPEGHVTVSPGISVDVAMLREGVTDQIRLWNALGVDPIQLGERELLIAGAGCASLATLSRAVDAGEYSIDADELLAWCVPVLVAMAPAAPLESPQPVPKPDV